MKSKLQFTANPWIFLKDVVKSAKTNQMVATLDGFNAEEKRENGLLIAAAPELMFALLAEEAYCCMDCVEGDQILIGLGYAEGSKMAFVKGLRKEALKKAGII